MAESIFRIKGYELLNGQGLEIGALNQAANIPANCSVTYCDVCSREDVIKFFPELRIEDLVSVDHLSDMDKDGLVLFQDNTFDFVILNHIVEHVANPIKSIREIFRIAKDGGLLVISAPDKNYTFDKDRELTPFSHLLDDYTNNTLESTDEHYIDFLKGVHPEVFDLSPEEIQERVDNVRLRREHVHVWDSTSFRQFLDESFRLLDMTPELLYETMGDENKFEYFSIWKK